MEAFLHLVSQHSYKARFWMQCPYQLHRLLHLQRLITQHSSTEPGLDASFATWTDAIFFVKPMVQLGIDRGLHLA
jgi:hypothetical protein